MTFLYIKKRPGSNIQVATKGKTKKVKFSKSLYSKTAGLIQQLALAKRIFTHNLILLMKMY